MPRPGRRPGSGQLRCHSVLAGPPLGPPASGRRHCRRIGPAVAPQEHQGSRINDMSDEAVPALDDECFFIAPIGKEGSPERNRSDGILDFIVGRAAQELNLKAVRGDQIGEPGQITLQVIAHILGAKAAVADLTGLNPNVFYELAVRHTARLPVVLIAEKDCKLPFDIAQMRTIFFDHTDLRSADQCRRDIVAQLREALNNGIVDSPIATSIEVRALQGGTAVERNIAELVTTIEAIASAQKEDSAFIRRIHRSIDRVGMERDHPFSYRALVDAFTSLQNLRELAANSNDDELVRQFNELLRPMDYIYRSDPRARRELDLANVPRLIKIAKLVSLTEGNEDRADEDIPSVSR